jgi:phage recombination protein Bet
MSNQPSTAVVVVEDQQFSQEKIDLLKSTICAGATNEELALFLEVCKLTRLNPFRKQIYAVKRWDGKAKREITTYQVGIDGFRAIAERTGDYSGQDAPQWCDENGTWTDVWLKREPPAAAKATVYRKGFDKPLTRVALFREYVQTDKDGKAVMMWSKMPSNQLFKCSEALALRAAFPDDLGGLHVPEEMDQADSYEAEAPQLSPGDIKAQTDPALKIAEKAPVISIAPSEMAAEFIANGPPLLSATEQRNEKFFERQQSETTAAPPPTAKEKCASMEAEILGRFRELGTDASKMDVNKFLVGWFGGRDNMPQGAENYYSPLVALKTSLVTAQSSEDAAFDMVAWGKKLAPKAASDNTLEKRFPGWPGPLLSYADAVMTAHNWTLSQLTDALASAYRLDPSDHRESRSVLLLMYF